MSSTDLAASGRPFRLGVSALTGSGTLSTAAGTIIMQGSNTGFTGVLNVAAGTVQIKPPPTAWALAGLRWSMAAYSTSTATIPQSRRRHTVLRRHCGQRRRRCLERRELHAAKRHGQRGPRRAQSPLNIDFRPQPAHGREYLRRRHHRLQAPARWPSARPATLGNGSGNYVNGRPGAVVAGRPAWTPAGGYLQQHRLTVGGWALPPSTSTAASASVNGTLAVISPTAMAR